MPESFVSADDVADCIGRSQDAYHTLIPDREMPFYNVGRLLMFRLSAVGRGVRGNAAADEDA